MYKLQVRNGHGDTWETVGQSRDHAEIENAWIDCAASPGYILCQYRITHNGETIETGLFR